MSSEPKLKEKTALFNIFDKDGTDHNTAGIRKICDEIGGISIPTYYKFREEYKRRKVVGEEFDISKAIRGDEAEIYGALFKSLQKGSPKSIEKAINLIMELRKNQEVKNELTSADYNKVGIRVRDALREEFRAGGGCCPICGFGEALYEESRLDKEREPEPQGEVAAVELPS